MLGGPGNLGQDIHEPGRGEHSSCENGVTTSQRDAESEPFVPGAGHVNGVTREDLHPVAPHLGASDGREFRRWHSLMAEIAVHVRGGSVARLPGVDHDYRATLAAELKGTG
jgi:hypothetical protein